MSGKKGQFGFTILSIFNNSPNEKGADIIVCLKGKL